MQRINRIAKVAEIDFLDGRLIITSHALQRFEQRWSDKEENSLLLKPLRTLIRKLKNVKEEKLGVGRHYQRYVRNRRQEARYFRDESKRWRFVIVMESGKYVLKTVEHPY